MLFTLIRTFLFALVILGLPYWVLMRRGFGTQFVHALLIACVLLWLAVGILLQPIGQNLQLIAADELRNSFALTLLGACTALLIAHLGRHYVFGPLRLQDSRPKERDEWSVGRLVWGASAPVTLHLVILSIALFLPFADRPPTQPVSPLAVYNAIAVASYVVGLLIASVGSGTLSLAARRH